MFSIQLYILKSSQYIRVYWLLFVVVFSLTLFSSSKSSAQQYNFTNFTVENGLSQSQILSVFQDTDGVMWFGTNGGGITKFDGKTYEYITDKDGLPDNVVFSIAKDTKGRIIVGTNNGLSILEAGKFKNYTTQQGLTHNRIYKVFIDNKGNILLGTGKGISVLRDTLCQPFIVQSTLDSALVFEMYQDINSDVWFSTLGNGVYHYNYKKGVRNYTPADGLGSIYAYAVIEKEKGVYWFLLHKGLYQLENGIVKKITIDGLASDATFYAATNYANNIFWFTTDRGLLKYDGKKFKRYTQDNGLINNNIWKILEDREHNLWFASKESGISKLSSEKFLVYNTANEVSLNAVSALLQAKNGSIYIGTSKGLAVFTDNLVKNYTVKDWKENSDVTALAELSDGTLLIGTSFGVLKFDGENFNRIENNSSIKGFNYIYDILIDNKNEIWLATKAGLAKIKNSEILDFNIEGLPKTFIYQISQDRQNTYWLGSDVGLYKYDGNKVVHFSEQEGFHAKYVYNFVMDSKKTLWIGTNSGIYRYGRNKFDRITEKNGLASSDILSLIVDKNDNIWAGQSNGVDRIKINEDGTYNIRHYGKEDGFVGEECLLNSILVDRQNHIWFGAEKGLMVFQPEFDRKNEFEPITRIKSVQLFGQKTDWKIFTDSVNVKNLPVNLELGYDRNYLTFNFIGVSHTAPAKVRYKYMLKGLDPDWLPETVETEKSYTSIPPGEYEFMVIANNGDGVWNKVPSTFKFTINPPFWKTGWFYSIIAGIVVMGIYSYIKIKSANIKIVKQNNIIEEKNEALNQANLLIAGKNKNITDSINYALRIQQSFLTSEKTLKSSLSDYFILYKPRDIVSGDFYWAFELPDRVLVACADSTGHGIPGAFMSLIGLSLLNEISHSKKITEPDLIIGELRRIIICALNPDELDEGGKDGMDLALISILKKQESDDTVKIHYAGGNSSIYIISEDDNHQKQLTEYKPDKQPVGYHSNMKPFVQQEIVVKKGSVIYMGTDGFADQFGGPRGKKIMAKQLKASLLEIAHEPLDVQRKKLDAVFMDWKGDLEQVDDVTIFGIKIS
jgi:ligand-binding sensor domain-containing protein/serine phosphatase RsbU (regulator of sigma subunit)